MIMNCSCIHLIAGKTASKSDNCCSFYFGIRRQAIYAAVIASKIDCLWASLASFLVFELVSLHVFQSKKINVPFYEILIISTIVFLYAFHYGKWHTLPILSYRTSYYPLCKMYLAENIAIITRHYTNAQFHKKENIHFLVQVNKHWFPHPTEWTNYQALFHLGMEDNRMNNLLENSKR